MPAGLQICAVWVRFLFSLPMKFDPEKAFAKDTCDVDPAFQETPEELEDYRLFVDRFNAEYAQIGYNGVTLYDVLFGTVRLPGDPP